MNTADIPALEGFSGVALETFFQTLSDQFDTEAANVHTPSQAEELRVRWLGRKQGIVTRVAQFLKEAPSDSKKEIGIRFNKFKAGLEDERQWFKTVGLFSPMPEASPYAGLQ